jgi:hypothetical protein
MIRKRNRRVPAPTRLRLTLSVVVSCAVYIWLGTMFAFAVGAL